jgi:hypothetical protein
MLNAQCSMRNVQMRMHRAPRIYHEGICEHEGPRSEILLEGPGLSFVIFVSAAFAAFVVALPLSVTR